MMMCEIQRVGCDRLRHAPTKRAWYRLLRAVLLPLLGATMPVISAAVEVTAFVDRSEVALGESVLLSIQITGTQQAPTPQITGVDELRAQYIGPATEMRIENGRSSTSITHRFQLFPQREGRFVLGPFAVPSDGEIYETQPVVLNVVQRAAGADAPGQGLTLEAKVDRSEPFVGERVPLTIRLLIPEGMRVDDLQFPTVQGDGLSVGALPQPAQHDEILGGRRFRVLQFATHFTPLRPGEVPLQSAMALSVLEASRRQRSIFGGMMGGMFAERRPLEVRAAPVPIRARPLPVSGRPQGFTGAVGTFDLHVTAAPTSVNAGDPITLRIEISGDGDLGRAHPPRLRETDGMRVYDPVVIKDAGLDRRGHEQVVIPQSPQVRELPALSFSFFDPLREEYRTVHRGPFAVAVAAAVGAPSAIVAEGEPVRRPAEVGPLGRDIVYIKGSPGTWKRLAGQEPHASAWFWLINALPPVAVAVLWWRGRRRDLLAANPRLRRRQEAPAVLRRGLDRLAGEIDERPFADGVWAVLSEYLAAMLDLPPGGVDGTRVASEMRRAGFAESACGECARLCDELVGERYAPGLRTTLDRREVVQRVLAAATALERGSGNGGRAARRFAATVALATGAACALVPGSATADAGSDSPLDAAFFAGNHSYAGERFDDALAHYEVVLEAGYESGALHFNRANAYFKRGDAARALASYLRAQRLLPRDPDVTANLEFAAESLDLVVEREPLWRRVSFAIAERSSAAELANAFTAVWWVFWLLLAVALVVPKVREASRVAARLVAVAAAVILIQWIYRATQLELRDAAVVADAGAVVRFEPDEAGTEHFTALPGSRLSIGEQRGDWLLVARGDGRRGWVRGDAVVKLR